MVSDMNSPVLLYLHAIYPQAPSKKAGKKVAATPKKGGAKGASKVAKVRVAVGYANIC